MNTSRGGGSSEKPLLYNMCGSKTEACVSIGGSGGSDDGAGRDARSSPYRDAPGKSSGPPAGAGAPAAVSGGPARCKCLDRRPSFARPIVRRAAVSGGRASHAPPSSSPADTPLHVRGSNSAGKVNTKVFFFYRTRRCTYCVDSVSFRRF